MEQIIHEISKRSATELIYGFLAAYGFISFLVTLFLCCLAIFVVQTEKENK